jgi:hypothetical protein
MLPWATGTARFPSQSPSQTSLPFPARRTNARCDWNGPGSRVNCL